MRRVGIYVDCSGVTIVVVGRRVPVWSASAPLDSAQEMGPSIASALDGLFDIVPRNRWSAMRVSTAVGLPWARVKLVKGVPSVRSHGELIALLRLNSSRFVASSRQVVITGATVTSATEARIGIVALEVVQAVTHAVTSRKLRLGAIVPDAALRVDKDGSASSDGKDTDEAIAARVAITGSGVRLGLSAHDNPAVLAPDVSVRRVAVAALCLAGVVAIALGNQLRTQRAELTRTRSAIHGIAVLSDSGLREDVESGRLVHDLATAADFARHRVSATLLLGTITQALPADAAITTIRIDTASIDIVALSPRTAAVVDALSDVADMTAPTIIGPVSREIVGDREFERATIRLHIVPDHGRGQTLFHWTRDRDR